MPNEQNQVPTIKVKRGNYDSLEIYEITRDELEIIKQGSPNSIFLNFSIALFTIFISTGATLLTVNIVSNRIFCIFIILLISSFIAGCITAVLWLVGKNIFKTTIQKIEARIEKKEYQVNEESIVESTSNGKVDK